MGPVTKKHFSSLPVQFPNVNKQPNYDCLTLIVRVPAATFNGDPSYHEKGHICLLLLLFVWF